MPAFYYRQHFLELLGFVDQHYGHVLDDRDHRLSLDFRSLDAAAQSLYIRLVNRKGRVFNLRKLRYPEIGELAGPLQRLRTAGWVASPEARHLEDILGLLTRGEIQGQLLRSCPGLSRTLKKAQLIELALERGAQEAFIDAAGHDQLFVQQHGDWVSFLLFLYFGECRDSLSRFTMRDMGLVRTHSFRASYEPRYADREEAREAFFFASRLAAFSHAGARVQRMLIDEAGRWPEPHSEAAMASRDSLACAMGQVLEKAGQPEMALAFYRRGDSLKCTERLIRLQLSTGHDEAARLRLEQCITEARSEEEWLFANDLLQRKFGRKRTTEQTDWLRSAATINLDEAYVGAPERAAIRYFEAAGQRAFRAENAPWRFLFGLLFWDELFCSDGATLHSPFEALPAALQDRSFYRRYRQSIEAKLAALADRPLIRRALLQTMARHSGTPNGVFRWRPRTVETVFALLEHADSPALAVMLRKLAEDYPSMRYGWPDLMIVDDAGVRFAEIKAEGDQLKRSQLLRLRQMRAAGLRADVLRVRWVLDPAQEYVVVDVETTGGHGEQHRITEIAAVKLRDGVIVDRYQSLINPQRAIPPGITRLTGISDAMVADAPVFAGIAGAFDEFIGEAIFVAHNVNFDYGFVSREYARLGQRFRRPKLCTCASMRKLYPGHDSYSLASLCERYQIPLKSHHRAMCDAEAAAELLLLVNERRAADLQDG